jgi:hypothetical protein
MNKNTNIDERQENLNESAPTLAAIPKVNPYAVPMNYFDHLEEVISKNVLATSLEAIPKENPFEVPANYFEALPLMIEKRIAATELTNIPKENPFEVPALYFDNLAVMIERKIAATELTGIPKENPYEVPAGYFERLDSEIIDNVLASQKKKGFEWIGLLIKPKYAVFFATLALAVFFVFKVSTVNRMDKYSFTEQEIANSGEINDIDEGTIIETLYSDNKTNALPKQKDIENYLLDNDVDESQITGQL